MRRFGFKMLPPSGSTMYLGSETGYPLPAAEGRWGAWLRSYPNGEFYLHISLIYIDEPDTLSPTIWTALHVGLGDTTS